MKKTEELKMMLNLQKNLKKMNNHLKGKPDEKLIKGYREAKKDFESGVKGAEQAMLIIKEELDRRGIEVEE